MYFAMPSWFVKVSQMREELVANNEQIHWVPGHIKKGRFGNWLADARDWNMSRNRFSRRAISDMGKMRTTRKTPLWWVPWTSSRSYQAETISTSIHRPGIDTVVIKRDGKVYRRTEEVFDCWFESGSMPYAQDHYPFRAQRTI